MTFKAEALRLADVVIEQKAEIERLRPIANATAILLALAYQYRDDLRHPVTNNEALSRRLEAIDAAIAKASHVCDGTERMDVTSYCPDGRNDVTPEASQIRDRKER